MNREFLKAWERRQLDSQITEISAKWDFERVLPTDMGESHESRVESHHERQIAVKAITDTLGSLFQRLPYCLAVVGVEALRHLDQGSRDALSSAPQEAFGFSWLPGDLDFVGRGAQSSLVIEIGSGTISAVSPFFLGADPRCLLIFSSTKVSPRMAGEGVSRETNHAAALRAAARLGDVLAFPALDGDVLVFVVRGTHFVPFIMRNGDE